MYLELYMQNFKFVLPFMTKLCGKCQTSIFANPYLYPILKYLYKLNKIPGANFPFMFVIFNSWTTHTHKFKLFGHHTEEQFEVIFGRFSC